jgi:signal transduction histidine kinase
MRLAVSHLAAVTASTFVYATGGFLLLLTVVILAGYQPIDVYELVPQFAMITFFVLIQIALITLCGVIVARIAAMLVSKKLLRQIAELEAGSNAIAAGQYDRQVEVITEDELGRFAESFNALTTQLGAAERQRRAFVANISHDLRTPIAVIKGHLDAQGHSDGMEVMPPETSFAAIEHEVQTLSRLIEDLFISSRIEEGVLPVERSPVSVGELASDAVASVRPYALKTGRVSVNAQVDSGVAAVLGDETRITQVINNLLHNAIRHTQAGGLVVIQVHADPDPAWVRIVVRDTGVGIPPEVLDKIFDRYYQGEDIGAKGGAGLGLSIVKHLVQMQGGQVWAESTMGEGASISVRLPAVQEPAVIARR